MAGALRSGKFDFIGGARPSIADPFLPRKIKEGRYDEIRECTGSNFCIAFETRPANLSCVQNPTIGEEYRRGWHPEHYAPAKYPDLAVLVVGAGPSGLECARVLGHRGFNRVHVVERDPAVGGHLAWTSRFAGMGEWARILNYRKAQLAKLANVEVHTGSELSAESVLEYGADVVVLATGARWAGARYPGDDAERFAGLAASRVRVMTPELVMMTSERHDNDAVVVWDGDGSYVGAGIAEHLASSGAQVTLVSKFDRVAPLLDLSFEGEGVRRQLREAGVKMRTGLTLVGAGETRLWFRDQFGQEDGVEATILVLVAHRVPDDALYEEIKRDPGRLEDAGIRRVIRIGDCLAPRELGYVIIEGHRVGRELEADNPNWPAFPKAEIDGESTTARFTLPDRADACR
ncbi:MAG TPA: FAD-dependent oxidoreductase [Acidimicrobiales bacterium]|nr:FAD-dependent oxidoreductase [Acidimicrobiales bacterium]